MNQPTLATALTLTLLLAHACSRPEPTDPATADPAAHVAAETPAPAEQAKEAPAAEAKAKEGAAAEPVAAAAAQEAPAEKNCGGDDQPLCPLGQWMDDNTRVAAENGDLEALAAAFHKIEFMAPAPSFNEGENAWNRIARIGAVRAEEGDLRASRKQCKACHKQWRDEYEENHWFREVPALPPHASQGDPDLSL